VLQEIQARVGSRLPTTNGTEADGDVHMIESSDNQIKNLKSSQYLVGHVLDEALVAGENLHISWPFRDGGIDNWEQAEALW
jgi:actin-related protein 9